MEQFCRTELIIGKENLKKLKKSNIIVFGIGGVGSFVVEGLVRAGIENITIVDNDIINESNINRQLIALHTTINIDKVEVMKKRILDINPNAAVTIHKIFVDTQNIDNLINSNYNYIVDAIDTVTSKLAIIKKSKELNIPIISCMGTGNKMHPEMFQITDISKTSVCPLAKVMRKELGKSGIKNIKVLYSKEEPIKHFEDVNIKLEENKKTIPGSISFVPSIAGLMIAGEVIRDLIN